ncbi:WD repeat-containing protein [Zymoseptoria brevis]|uniref:WD repeat-containing protein n=1 Tax=Zymoseptoria brevis TaxID=1047168 RepID=A0A0F4G6V9_9PEZI|nr:WD repeat-containing protein [Zymoseptoria brevis]
MAPAPRPRTLRKDTLPTTFKSYKPQVFSETARASTLAPNIRSISWSPTGNAIAQCTSVNIRVWNSERPDVKASTEMKDGTRNTAHTSGVEKVAFNPRMEGVLASTGLDGMVKVWDIRLPGGATGIVGGGPMGKAGVTPRGGEYKVGDQGLFLTWHPAGTQLLVGRRDDVVTALDVRKLDTTFIEANADKFDLAPEDRTPVKDKGSYNMMAFSNSGREVFATTAEGPVKILDYPTMKPLYTLSAHTSSTYAVSHSPIGNYVAVGASDSLVSLWDTSSWMCARVLSNHTSAVRDVSFSFDGTYLVAGCGADRDGDKGLSIWHADMGEVVHTIETVNPVTWVSWHPLRYAIAYGGDPGGLKVVGAYKD